SSLSDFKDAHKISDHTGNNISKIFGELYDDFLHFNSPFSDAFFENSDEKNKGKEIEKNDQLRNLLEECIKTNPTLIPYSELTNIIFTVDTTYSNKNSE